MREIRPSGSEGGARSHPSFLPLFRTHGLIKKLSGTHRYVLTEKGSTTITALLAARQANINQLTQIAA